MDVVITCSMGFGFVHEPYITPDGIVECRIVFGMFNENYEVIGYPNWCRERLMVKKAMFHYQLNKSVDVKHAKVTIKSKTSALVLNIETGDEVDKVVMKGKVKYL